MAGWLTDQRRLAIEVLLITFALSACAGPAPAEPAQTPALPTETPASTLPTETPLPTATPDPSFIDMDKFHTVPASYDYLLAHPEEFVRSPDPINERATFDRWFDEGLVPALGPIAERPINTVGAALEKYLYGFSLHGYKNEFGIYVGWPVTRPLSFFYFETDGVVYPTVCITAAAEKFGETIKHTACIAIFDSPVGGRGTGALETLETGRFFYHSVIYFDAAAMFPDLEVGAMEEMTKALGDYSNVENKITFGFGQLNFMGLEYQKSLFTPITIERDHSPLIPLLRSQMNNLMVPAAEYSDEVFEEWLTMWVSTLTGQGVDERIRLESASLVTILAGEQVSPDAPYYVAILDIAPEIVEGSPWLADGNRFPDERGHYGIPLSFEFTFTGQYLWASSLSLGLLPGFIIENDSPDCPADEAFVEEVFSNWLEKFMLEEVHSFDQISGYEVAAVTPIDEAGTYHVDFSVMPVGMEESRWLQVYSGALDWTTGWLTGSTATLTMTCVDEGIRIAIFNPEA